jgi:hypothetical protein
MRTLILHLLAAALLLASAAVSACPLCLGWGQSSKAQQLVASPQAVLALPTDEADSYRVLEVIKGEQPADGIVEGGYPRAGPAPGDTKPSRDRPLLIVRTDPLSTWVILGTIDSARADWLRALAAGKPAAELTAEEWSTHVALVAGHLNDPDPLAVELATAELAAAPYAALRTAKPLLDADSLRRTLADPALAARHSFSLVLLGIAGDAQDAARLEQRLQSAWQSGTATNLHAMLAADLELTGPARVVWIESYYLADPDRTAPEIRAALLALSVHGHADAAISRQRVIQAYRLFMKAHPEIAGDVAPDLAAWQYWDVVPDYLSLIESGVKQQYSSRLAVQAYLQQSPQGKTASSSPEATTADGNAELLKPLVPHDLKSP